MATILGRAHGLLGRFLIRLIRVYQATKFLRPPVCRFSPSCSEYAAQAITRYGAGRGFWMTLKRVGRCHPFHPGGYDPVPESGEMPDKSRSLPAEITAAER